MKTSEVDIYKKLNKNNSVLLVGLTGSGKTWFVKNRLIPLIESNSKTVQCLNGYTDNQTCGTANYVIVDEFETFLDKDYLQKIHPQEKPYYENKYVNDILKWHQFLAKISEPTLFILTRNEKREIDNIIKNINKTDWGKSLVVIEYRSSKST